MERKNLWAPWRMKYIRGLSGEGEGCFICGYVDSSDKDAENFILLRTQSSILMFNRFPYNNGHLLIAPKRHIATMDEASEDELLDMTRLMRDSQVILGEVLSPHGFNVGMNFGRCSGAGLPGHMHVHVVPRWDGDTNFMHVVSDTDVISQSLEELYVQLRQVIVEKGLG